jgi:pyruvate/2-oxoglutarate dehydrogenase complex dihydrolipoamide dehydrogenase (E3) component
MVSDHDDAGALPWLHEKRIDLLRGDGRLAGPGIVVVDDEHYAARHVVIATGSEPVMPPIPGLAELEDVWTNREATALDEAPRRLLVLGAGAVGVEMAQAVRRMGAEVAVVEGMDHVLPREPRALGDALGEALAADGIELRFGQYAAAARRDGDDYVLDFPDGGELRGDRLLVATGRRPRIEALGLATAGIDADLHGIRVDRRMAAAPNVWAIGDVTGIWPLTYVGNYQARIAAANIVGERREASYDAVPRVVFTDPQAAAVGASEGERTATVAMSAVARTATYTRAYAEHPGFLTLVADGERLTGAYALGPEAGEWLQQATLAIRAGVPLSVMRDTIQPFPTFSEAFVEALAQLTSKVAVAA